MDRMKKALDKIKRSPLTLDAYFRKYFEMETSELKDFNGGFHELLASQLTIHMREGQGCVNLEIENPAFDELKSVIKNCVEKNKLKKKGCSNANTSA